MIVAESIENDSLTAANLVYFNEKRLSILPAFVANENAENSIGVNGDGTDERRSIGTFDDVFSKNRFVFR